MDELLTAMDRTAANLDKLQDVWNRVVQFIPTGPSRGSRPEAPPGRSPRSSLALKRIVSSSMPPGTTKDVSGQDGSLPGFHLMPQPMLGTCGSGTGDPARTRSSAARNALPVTAASLRGRDSSNSPR